MSEYLCLTLIAEAGETESAFKARLTAFWSHVIRTRPDTYEAVYAEAKHFDSTDGRVSRQYMVEANATTAVTEVLTQKGIATAPVDTDDVYTKYEASGSEWFQIDH